MAERRDLMPTKKSENNKSRGLRFKPKPKFTLQGWYASEDAKRSFGPICQAVNETGKNVTLSGSPDKPLLVLANFDESPPSKSEVEISIDDARANWSSITYAAMMFDVRFRIRGKKKLRAVMTRHPINRHSACKYASAMPGEMSGTIIGLAAEVRQLSERIELLSGKIEVTSRHYRELYRAVVVEK